MAADVFFVDIRSRSFRENSVSKVKRLFDAAGLGKLIRPRDLTAVKVHFGERGNHTHIPPVFVRAVVDKVKEAGGKPFLTDTGTLYTGGRKNAVDHIVTAVEHGFAFSVVGAPIIIADGLKGDAVVEVPIAGKRFSSVKIARDIVSAGSMMVVSHFKGHELAGFGGAVKNLAMGCAPAAGKKEQHSARFFVNEEKCVGCGDCVAVCPVGAARVKDEKSRIEKDICIGCGECVGACPEKAIDLDWATDIAPFMERMTEYALGAAAAKKGRAGYINFVLSVTPDCDCIPWSDAPIVPDVGILASLDPLALDKACADLVNQKAGVKGSHLSAAFEPGEDKFKGLWSHTRADVLFSHGEAIGLGTTDYKLVTI